jgi:dipeptidyl aminopeptidase/acylaminoacyl peptidase
MPKSTLRRITADDLYDLNVLADVRISPEGSRVVYSLQRVDRKSQKRYTNLWLVPVADGEPQQFTWGDQSDTQPRWSPDGRRIAFLSNRLDADKPAPLFTIPVDGGEARPLADLHGRLSSFSWSPDGKKLVCTLRKTDPEELERQKDEQKKKLGVVARQYDRVFYKLDGSGYLPKERLHLWVVDAGSGKARQITDHPIFDEDQPAWSPDGKWIVFVSNRHEKPDLAHSADDVFVIPARGGEMRRLDTPPGSKGLPAFSPDGKWIAYFGSENQKASYKNRLVYLVPADGSAPARSLTEAYDLHADSSVINDIGSPEMMPPTWSKDSRRIYFQVVKHGGSFVYSIDLQGKDLQQVLPAPGSPPGVVGSFSFDDRQIRVAYFFGRMQDTAQVYIRELPLGKTVPQGEAMPLTHHNRELLDQIDLGEIEEVWFKGTDGNDLQGWILKPPGFDPAQKYPSIMEIHGGPMTQYGYFFMHEFYYLAAHGYVVYFCNPRGGRGYGEAHTAAIWGEWGGVDYADLMAWNDWVQNLPYIDTGRMGVTGGSYGGYMTVWIIGHTRRFKAAVTQRCVSNLISFWGSTDFNWIWQEVFGDKPPFENVEKFWQHSPIKYIGAAATPTLVIHSENDMRCPIEQGEQVFVALQRLGVDSEMVRFPDESHGLSRGGRTDRRIARLGHILRWFDTYLKEKSDE